MDFSLTLSFFFPQRVSGRWLTHNHSQMFHIEQVVHFYSWIIADLSSWGVLLQPVVYLRHHRRMRRLHCAAGRKQTVSTEHITNVTTLNIIHHLVFICLTVESQVGIQLSALSYIFLLLPLEGLYARQILCYLGRTTQSGWWYFSCVFTFSVPTCSGTLPSLQSVEKS